jgi:3',5'-cyclic AMP phosphodiesterase CpdA
MESKFKTTPLNRRDFIGLGAGALTFAAMSVKAATDCQIWFAPELHGEDALKMPIMKDFKPTKLQINVGAKKPFRMLHISDSHIATMSAKDLAKADDVELKWYEGRRRHFATWGTGLAAALVYSKVHNLPIIHTGDLADYLSDANCPIVKHEFEGLDCLYAVGNHEKAGTHRPGPREHQYAAARAKAEPFFPNPFPVHSKIVNGVNFVAFDNTGLSNDIFDEQFAKIEQEFKKGLPVVLAYHIPFFEEGIATAKLSITKSKRIKTIGDFNEAYMAACPGKWTYKINKKLSVWLKEQKNLKAMLCGHFHQECQGQYTETAKQYVAGATYMGNAYDIEFV